MFRTLPLFHLDSRPPFPLACSQQSAPPPPSFGIHFSLSYKSLPPCHPKRLTFASKHLTPEPICALYRLACLEPPLSLPLFVTSHSDRSEPLTGAPSCPFPLIDSVQAIPIHFYLLQSSLNSQPHAHSVQRLCSGSTTPPHAFLTDFRPSLGLHENHPKLRGRREGMAPEENRV